MKPVSYYFMATGSWFLAYGIQTVTFSWLVTIVLNESADKVGIAQMCFLLPSMFFMLFGGALADQYGGKRIAMLGQAAASIAPLVLAAVVYFGHFSYLALLVYAAMMGSTQALVTPSRDGLLALVADGQIQRLVVQVSMIQFGLQVIGFMIASTADQMGAVAILLTQSLVLITGIAAYGRLRVPIVNSHSDPDQDLARQIFTSIHAGYRSVISSPSMRMVVLQNCAMGVFFMGSYIVTLPLLLRELYDGGSQELSWMNAANSVGLVLTIFVLLRIGDIKRQGRALLMAQGIGAFALASAGIGLGFPMMVVALFCWGLCGGIAMTMARTIMQEQAPVDQRARMMAFFSFSFMGSGPLGALLCGYLVTWLGPVIALTLASMAMFVVVLCVAAFSDLWQMSHDAAATTPQTE